MSVETHDAYTDTRVYPPNVSPRDLSEVSPGDSEDEQTSSKTRRLKTNSSIKRLADLASSLPLSCLSLTQPRRHSHRVESKGKFPSSAFSNNANSSQREEIVLS